MKCPKRIRDLQRSTPPLLKHHPYDQVQVVVNQVLTPDSNDAGVVLSLNSAISVVYGGQRILSISGLSVVSCRYSVLV